jgi:heme exporter protein A
MTQELILEIKSLTLTVGYKTLFRDKQLSFPSQGLVLIHGENGVGKSTLLKEIYLNARDGKDWIWPMGKKSIGYLGHDLGLYSSLTLCENLEHFSSLSTSPLSESDTKSLIEYYGLVRRRNDPLYMYSRGMKQKAAIIRCFVTSPQLLLLDEPYTGLDTGSISLFTKHLNAEKKKRLILIVLHEIPKDLEIDSSISLGVER